MQVTLLCRKVGMSPQNFYKTRERRKRRTVDEGLVRNLVRAERALQPRIGGVKLHVMLRESLEASGIYLGRDRFFEVLRNQGLLVEPLPKAPRTTCSNHSLPVFRNLLKDLKVTAPHQALVCDITYIRTSSSFLYLSLVTDAGSRKIVGYHLGETLESRDTRVALEMALDQLPDNRFPIHHSDRGCQYCSHEYVERATERGLSISMTEENHCAENAMAERVNGILKQEYSLKSEFRTREQAQRAVDQAVQLYNNSRPHRALKFQSPAQVHSHAA